MEREGGEGGNSSLNIKIPNESKLFFAWNDRENGLYGATSLLSCCTLLQREH